ncbi:MAG: hypothetical protein R3Y06_04445 [Faecalibacterium sp.]
METKTPLTPEEIAAREAMFRAREAQLATEQAEFEAEKAAAALKKNTAKKADPLTVLEKLKKDGFPSLVAPKERLYDKMHVSVKTMDIIIGITIAAIVVVLVVGLIQR